MELLVVVAILVILGSLLFPGFDRARRGALQTSCASNLRQVGEAMGLYLGEHDQRFPAMQDQDGYWTAAMVPYIGQINGQPDTVFICPGKAVRLTVAKNFASGGRTYGASRLVLGPTTAAATVPTLRAVQIAHPSSVVLVADSNQVPGNNGNSSFDLSQAPFNSSQTLPEGADPDAPVAANMPNADKAPSGAIRFRHPGKTANALMVDGHVEALRLGGLLYRNIYPLGQ